MTKNRKDKSSEDETLPPVSHADSGSETAFSVPPPKIKGYKIIEELGVAGQGRVWRAVQLSTRREVALKVPRTGLLSSEKSRARFEREVEVAARLKHPNIARIHDSGIHEDRYYYAMELIEGVPLDQYVQQHNLTQRQILELMRAVCQAVQHAHQNGVIHRDLKPSNIIVTDAGQPYIVDFGLAKNITEGILPETISIEGEALGTPAYMSPEQAAGEMDRVDTRTDVYGLGVILFILLTGRNPHDMSGSRSQVLRRISEEEIRRPCKVNPKIDKELESLLLKSLAHDPDQRYISAGELARDIDNYLKDEPLSAKGPTTMYFLRNRIRKHRRSISMAFLLLIVMIITGLCVFYAMRPKPTLPRGVVTLTFGVYTSDRDTVMYRKFLPIINHLQENAGRWRNNQQLHIRPRIFRTYDEGIDAIVRGDVDIVRVGPAPYIIAKSRNPNIRLLVMEKKNGSKSFKGRVIVRKDSDIYDLSDLRGRSVAFVDRNSTIGGHLFQAELAKAGIRANDLSKFAYLGSHTAVAEAVRDGEFDAGAVKESTYEEYKHSLRVLADFNNVTKPWIAKRGLDPNVFKAIQNTLLNLKDTEVLKESRISDFVETSDSEYDPVRERMKEAEGFFPWWYSLIHRWPAMVAVVIIVSSAIYVLVTVRRRTCTKAV